MPSPPAVEPPTDTVADTASELDFDLGDFGFDLDETPPDDQFADFDFGEEIDLAQPEPEPEPASEPEIDRERLPEPPAAAAEEEVLVLDELEPALETGAPGTGPDEPPARPERHPPDRRQL